VDLTLMDGLNMSRRIRRTPYTDRVEQNGVRGFSVVNHMLLPKAFQPTLEEDYWHLRAHVQIWDVSCQRQVQIAGTGCCCPCTINDTTQYRPAPRSVTVFTFRSSMHRVA